MRRIVTVIILLFIGMQGLLSNEVKNRVGAYANLNFNLHSADFNKLQDIPNCCPEFTNGLGNGYSAGLLYERKIFRSSSIGLRLGIATLNGTLSNTESTTVIVEGNATDGEFKHTMNGYFSNFGLDAIYIYNILPNLQFNIGLRSGLNIKKEYAQQEEITKPLNSATFVDEDGNDTFLRIRNKYSGEIPQSKSFAVFGLIGLSYQLPLNQKRSLMLVPEVFYRHSLTEFVENSDWKVNSISAGIAIKYSIQPKPKLQKLHEREILIDTIRVETEIIVQNVYKAGIETLSKRTERTDSTITTIETLKRTDTLFQNKQYVLKGDIQLFGVDSSGREIENPVFAIEEFVSNRLLPLLNYIFFDEDSFEIPSRYKLLEAQEQEAFHIDSLYWEDAIGIYYQTMNIIGWRLSLHPTATITLIGTNADIANEAGNIEISQKRAESVKDYFVNVWNISPERIKIQTKNLPDKASVPKAESDKAAENRRVEIYSHNQEILKPLFIEKLDRFSNPPIARFKQEVIAEAGLRNWQITAFQNSTSSDKFIYSDSSRIVSIIDWELDKIQRITPKHPEPIYYSLNLTDSHGKRESIDKSSLPLEIITIEQKRSERVGDYEIERFSLILFDFDDASLKDNNLDIIKFVRDRIRPSTQIEIIGYTDRTGDAEYNRRLSLLRAQAARTALGQQNANTIGIGNERLLYDNELPEGRFLCRTVEIILQTKVE